MLTDDQVQDIAHKLYKDRAFVDYPAVLALYKAFNEAEGAILDSSQEAFKQICDAAAKSPWIPDQYAMDDWVSDICTFLAGDHFVPGPDDFCRVVRATNGKQCLVVIQESEDHEGKFMAAVSTVYPVGHVSYSFGPFDLVGARKMLGAMERRQVDAAIKEIETTLPPHMLAGEVLASIINTK